MSSDAHGATLPQGSGLKQPYHLVDPSPWPIIGAMGGFLTLFGIVLASHFGSYITLIAGLVIGTRVADRIARHLGAGIVLAIGFTLLTAGLVAGATTALGTGYGFTAGWIAVVGAGMGCVLPTAMGVAIDELSVDRAGSGSALIQALRQAGGTIGVAILGTVLNTA
jgi:hypothetical protein